MNKKLTIATIIYALLGAVITLTLFFLNYFKVISADNIVVNAVILAITAALSLVSYFYIFKKCRDDVSVKDCVISGIIYVLLFVVLMIPCFQTAGVQFSTFSIWVVSLFHLTIYNIVFVLNKKAKIPNVSIQGGKIKHEKYYHLKYYLKVWANFLFVGFYIIAIVNLFFPCAEYYQLTKLR